MSGADICSANIMSSTATKTICLYTCKLLFAVKHFLNIIFISY